MAEPQPPIHFEDIPIDEARRMGRGSRMDPQLYQDQRAHLCKNLRFESMRKLKSQTINGLDSL
jgi:hypothetical protein